LTSLLAATLWQSSTRHDGCGREGSRLGRFLEAPEVTQFDNLFLSGSNAAWRVGTSISPGHAVDVCAVAEEHYAVACRNELTTPLKPDAPDELR
jgi:hypothetical protein